MSNRRRKERLAARRARTGQAKAVRRFRRVGSRGTAIAAAASLGLSLAAGLAPASAGTGTVGMIADIDAGAGSSEPVDLAVMGGFTYFAVNEAGGGRALWKTNGTAAGTTRVKSFVVDSYNYGPQHLTAVGSLLYFSSGDTAAGQELWKSDGTAAGTAIVKDLPDLSIGDDSVGELTAMGSTLFFTSADDVHGRELWKSDGTDAGTVIVKDIEPNPGGYGSGGPAYLTVVNGSLFFGADSGTDGRELWKSDGTEAGTVQVKDVMATVGAPPEFLTSAGNTLFFSTQTATARQLWKSDGTTGGTVMLKEISGPPNFSSYISQLTAVGSRVYFTASDDTNGAELWTSDGTESGTVLVADINPGVNDSAPYPMIGYGGRLLFSAREATHGRELWASDGTAAGTVLVGDLDPGPAYSSPNELTVMGDSVIFAASDSTHGRELWKYSTAVPLPSNQFTLPLKAKANAKKGFITVKVTVPGAGVLRRGPSAGSPVRKGSTTIGAAGAVKVKVLLTKKGLKKLKRLGKMKVAIAFTYTPTGGKALTKTKKYVFTYTG